MEAGIWPVAQRSTTSGGKPAESKGRSKFERSQRRQVAGIQSCIRLRTTVRPGASGEFCSAGDDLSKNSDGDDTRNRRRASAPSATELYAHQLNPLCAALTARSVSLAVVCVHIPGNLLGCHVLESDHRWVLRPRYGDGARVSGRSASSDLLFVTIRHRYVRRAVRGGRQGHRKGVRWTSPS